MVKGKRKGKIVVLHLAARYPFAGVIWQLLHHLIGFRQLGLDVYYVEEQPYVYDPTINSNTGDTSRNLKVLGDVLDGGLTLGVRKGARERRRHVRAAALDVVRVEAFPEQPLQHAALPSHLAEKVAKDSAAS